MAAAQQAVDRTFTSTLAKLALAGGAAYVLWHYMWQKSEEPLPEPASEAVSTDVLCSMLPLLPPGWRSELIDKQGQPGTQPPAAAQQAGERRRRQGAAGCGADPWHLPRRRQRRHQQEPAAEEVTGACAAGNVVSVSLGCREALLALVQHVCVRHQ